MLADEQYLPHRQFRLSLPLMHVGSNRNADARSTILNLGGVARMKREDRLSKNNG
ncbi:hypothetical protein PISMIDRAFT_678374 [Pisolithus microcarpus 441]|uniref:Uncharacterized protein n=1 Tax=Pisolithus microcarpus 441 TaxID=765257 RepID=A0A0C9ZXF2_9AGAM|nr:hypothetical protein PISMIDRAFT_678374 [Pisolithus microcarpus 441]